MMLWAFDVQTCSLEVLDSVDMADRYFGEGATVVGNHIYQLTYMADEILKWQINGDSITLVETLGLPSGDQPREGWGIAYRQSDGLLYMSDGSSTIFVVNPSTWTTVKTIQVTRNGSSLDNINEMEIIQTYDDYIFFNRFTYNTLHMAELSTGKIVKEWDLTELKDIQADHVKNELFYGWSNNVLNGIAYYEENDSFILTGKNWDFLFEVELQYK